MIKKYKEHTRDSNVLHVGRDTSENIYILRCHVSFDLRKTLLLLLLLFDLNANPLTFLLIS